MSCMSNAEGGPHTMIHRWCMTLLFRWMAVLVVIASSPYQHNRVHNKSLSNKALKTSWLNVDPYPPWISDSGLGECVDINCRLLFNGLFLLPPHTNAIPRLLLLPHLKYMFLLLPIYISVSNTPPPPPPPALRHSDVIAELTVRGVFGWRAH